MAYDEAEHATTGAIDAHRQRLALMMRQLAHHLAHHNSLAGNDFALMRQNASAAEPQPNQHGALAPPPSGAETSALLREGGAMTLGMSAETSALTTVACAASEILAGRKDFDR